jgi:hypothetical protein
MMKIYLNGMDDDDDDDDVNDFYCNCCHVLYPVMLLFARQVIHLMLMES